jgi:hypothetical protein
LQRVNVTRVGMMVENFLFNSCGCRTLMAPMVRTG